MLPRRGGQGYPLPVSQGRDTLGLNVLMIAVCVLASTGGYFVVRRIDALSGLMVDQPVLGIVVYAAACVLLIGALFRWGQRHLGIVRRVGVAGPLALFAASMPAIGGFLLLGSLGVVGQALRDMGMAGVAVYAAGFMLLAGCALLPTYAQAVLGGWAFKFALGFPAALIGITGAAVIGYVLGARATGDRIVGIIQENPKWEAVRQALAGGGFWKTLGLVTLLRLPINSPFAVSNLVMASVRLPLLPYVLGTIIGIAPRTGVVVYLGAEIQGALEEGMDKPRWLVVSSIAVFVGALLLIGHVANRAIERVTSESPENEA